MKKSSRKGLVLVFLFLTALLSGGAALITVVRSPSDLAIKSLHLRLVAAECALAEGRASDAEALLKPLAESDDPKVHAMLGKAYAALRNSSLAIFHFLKAHDKDRNSPDVNRGLGRAYSELGLHDLALPYLERVVQLDPNDAGTWRAMAKAYRARHRLEDASHALKKSAQLNPADMSAIRELSEITMRQSRPMAPHEVRPTYTIPSMSVIAESRLEYVGRRP